MKSVAIQVRMAVSSVVAMLSMCGIASAQLSYSTGTRSDGKNVVTFTSGSGTWTVPAGVSSVEVLVVGGGGSSGGDWSTGAGAGGMYFTTSYSVTPGSTVSISVGAGGPAVANGVNGQNGSSSSFDSMLIAYGGYGSPFNNYTDAGDQGGYSVNGGSTVVPGNPGGDYSPFDGNWCSGGGAGHAGYKGNSQPGGIGLQCAITGTNQYYAGGGGANGGGAGGAGGGGAGVSSGGVTGDSRSSGGTNTGGGAGGHAFGGSGSGGSGVVIVAFELPPGTPTGLVATAGDAQVGLTWNAVSGASGYKVATSNATDHSVVTNTTASASYTKTGLSNGTQYYFSVAATNGAGASAYCTPVSATPNIVANYSSRPDGYTVVTFTNGSGTWTVPSGVGSVEVLVVGGGGSSGGDWSTGAGAGGMYYTTSYSVTPGSSVSIAVGAGGTAVVNGVNGNNGSISSFDSMLIAYGGYGSPFNNYTDAGDQGGYSVNGGSTVVPGNPGGDYSPFDGNWCSGGGAGHAGYKGNSQPGGIGLQCAITGTNQYYAGGGGANGGGAGGAGGGGAGVSSGGVTGDSRSSGGANTGGGAGGHAFGGSGSGGSGIVIVAYLSAPDTPSGLGATAGDAQVALTWGSVPGASGYKVTTSNATDHSVVTNTTAGASYTKTGLNNGTTYYFSVAATNGGGESAYCAPVSETPMLAPPTTPTGLTASPGSTQVGLSWSTVSGATGYKVTTSNATDHSVVTDTTTSPSLTKTGLSNGTTYYFRVAATNEAGDSAYCAPVSATPLPPITPVTYTRADEHTVALFTSGSGTWTVPAGVSNVEVLVVGGGGSSGGDWSTGAGAGGMYYTASYAVTPGGAISINVGTGGAAVANGVSGKNGSSSSFGTMLIAYGGYGSPFNNYTDAGDQGGYSTNGGSTVVAGNPGGDYSPFDGNWCSGGGAGHAGYKGNSQPGGIGLQCAITGTNQYYAGGGGANGGGAGGAGGGGAGVSSGGVTGDSRSSGGANTGGGAGGHAFGGSGSGGSGIVIVSYLPPPGTPTGMVASPGNTQVSLTWTAVSGASGYKVVTSNATDHSVVTNTSASASYTQTGLSNGTTYYFSVAATNSTGESAYCAPVSATPNIVANYTSRPDGYTVVTFTNGSGSWTVPAGVSSVEVLVVGGGGSSGGDWSTGAGGGGMYYTTSYAVTPGNSVAISVGAGGTAVANGVNGNNGASSSFDAMLIAYGGYGSPCNNYTDAGDQGGYSINGGSTVVPGNPGGDYSPFDGNWCSGGGAGHAGYKGNSQPGGSGLQCAITGTNQYYAGGGGANGGGAGGAGGGGAGVSSGGVTGDSRSSGAANTGGGAGGHAFGGSGSGGSGIVIVAYLSAPETPSGLVATPGDAEVVLSWTAVPGASGYKVTTSNSTDHSVVTNTTASAAYTKTGLNNSTLYYFSVAATNGAGESAYCAPVSATPMLAPPATPTGLTASPGSTQVGLSWSPVSGATGYKVTTSNATDHSVVTDTATSASLTKTGLSNGTPYYFRVAATNEAGDSAYCAPVSATPLPPITPVTHTRADGKTVATFSSGSGTWTVPAGVSNLEVLVVGGGGASDWWSGGAGAGGMYFTNAYAVTPGNNVTIIVGAGGTGLSYDYGGLPNNNGGLSQFGSQLIAYGGNGGADYSTANGGNQGGYSLNGGSSVTPGTAPAEPRAWNWWSGSGAGAAGTAGGSAAGGIGVQCAITGTNKYYAGGGGANAHGAGGLGGGGSGPVNMGDATNPGQDGLGGGAGGGFGGPGANGGSGVVIVAYLVPPDVPTGLNATYGDTQVALSWSAASGAAAYNVKQSLTSGSGYVTITTVSGTAYTNTGLSNGTPYYYVVSATNGAGESANSAEASATPNVPPPPAPTGLAATAGDTQVALSWAASSGATGYEVKRSLISGSGFLTIATTAGTSYTNTGLSNGTTYFYVVAATNLAGPSADSAEASATPTPPPPPTPTGLVASPGDTQVALTWTASSGATAYRVTTSNATDHTVTTDTTSATSLTRTGLSNGTLYYFRVAATNVYGSSSYSAPVGAIPAPALAPVYTARSDRHVVATFTSGSGTWTVPAGVHSVEVLVVGGGGGGGGQYSSGSGAGGMYYTSAYTVTSGGNISVVVGAGGTGGTGSGYGSSGSYSMFGSLIAYGGGPGLGYTDGGDQGGYSVDGGGTVVPGNPGMHYSPMDGNWSSGGGAGHVGYKGDGQPGGVGATCSITGSSVYYAGGGGATGNGLGGLGGGGKGANNIPECSGQANTGGGAGGSWGLSNLGATGGSGVVIVSYALPQTLLLFQ